MAIEDHEKARILFEKDVLPTLFNYSLAFCDLFIKTPPNSKLQLEICQNSLSLLLKTLSWDFSTTVYLKPGYEKEDNQINPSDNTWKRLLSDPKISNYLFKLHQLFHFNSDVSHIIRQSLSQLATISTNCFDDDLNQAIYIQNFIEGIFELIQKSFKEMKNQKINFGQEIFDYGKIILRLILTFKLKIFIEMKNFQKFLENLYQFTNHVLTLTTTCEDEWIIECTDALLDSWVCLLPSFDFEITNDNKKFIELVKACCVNVFIKFLETKLNSKEERFDEEYLMNEQLTSIGNLGRQDIGKSLDLLNNKLSEKLTIYNQMIKNKSIQEYIYDEIEWIFKFLGYILADDLEAETPLIPESIEDYVKNVPIQKNSFFNIFNNIVNFNILEMTLISQNQKDFLSPRVSETMIWMLQRFCKTYLFPESSNQIFLNLFCETEQGRKFMDLILEKIKINVYLWQEDLELSEKSLNLLKSLIDKPNIAKYFIKTKTWNEMVIEDSKSYEKLKQNDNIKSKITECLLIGSSYHDDLSVIEKYFLIPLNLQFESILKRENFNKVYQTQEMIKLISYCLSKYRGIARGSFLYNFKIIFSFFMKSKLLENIVQLSHIYREYDEILELIFNFFKETVESQNIHLDLQQSVYLYQACIEMMKIYTKHNQGRIRSTKIDKESSENKFLDLLIQLEILENLTSKDFLDFSTDESTKNIDIASVIFVGIETILPLITIDFLQFPSLCQKYFSLISYLTENYTSKFLSLNPELFKQILQSIEFGIKHHESQISKLSFDAILAIIQHSKGNPLNQKYYKEMVDYFLSSIFNILLYEKFSTELLENISLTLFAFLIWNKDQFITIVNKFIENSKDNKRLSESFNILQDGIQLSWDKKNKKKFIENIQKFSSIVRSFTFRK